MRNIPVLILLLLVCPLFGTAQNNPDLSPKHRFFQLPPQASSSDYRQHEVVLRVKDEYRAYCSSGQINLPPFGKAMDLLQGDRLEKAFPGSQPPTEPVNRLGQQLVDLSLIYNLHFSVNADIEDVVNLLLETGLFEYVEPVYLYQTLFDPDDPDTASQYYLSLVRARDAWDISQGDTSIVIGIVDTGFSFGHDDLETEVAYNLNDTIDGIDNDGNGYIDDYRGWDFGGDAWLSTGDNDPTWGGPGPATDHGVIVSGPAGAATDNGVFMASLGFKCRLLPVKVSINQSPQIYRGYQGVVYAADMGAQIINLSWGGTLRSRMGEDAVNYAAINKGALVVAAAGNTPLQLDFYPASYHNVFSIGGTQQNDAFWNSSPTFGTTFSYLIDACAPSRDIFTTGGNNGTFSATGTSLGAPIACGIAGLIKAHYPNYTNAQVGQRLRMTSDENIYSINPAAYQDKMGRGRVNAYRALTDTTPGVRALEYEFYTDDGLMHVGDTVEVRVRFVNYLDPVTDLQIDLTTPSFGQIEITHGSVYAGDLGMMDTVSTWLAPFKIVIRNGTAPGFKGYLRFAYTGSNYSDWEYIPIFISPDYVNADANRIETSLNGTGRWGYTNFPNLNIGQGLILDGVGGIMNDAGFLIGASSSAVSNNIENQGGGADNHFTNSAPLLRQEDLLLSDLEVTTGYTDAGAGGNAIGVNVLQNSYQWEESPHDGYIIQEYEIVNTTASPLTGLYAGMYFDLDVYWRSNNTSRYDSLARCIYNYYETFASLWNFGVALLTNDSLHGFAAHPDSFAYTTSAKWTALTSPPASANLPNTNVVQFASAGPFDIMPGDTHRVAFALVVADSVPHLRETVQRAHDSYWCIVRGGVTAFADLGPDIIDCGNSTNAVLDPGSGFSSYLWNNGATTPTLSVNTSGAYHVTVTDANGCEDREQINVQFSPGLNAPGFSCVPSQVFVGDTVFFTDTTGGAWEWGWDFGDGSSLCPVTSGVSHVYNQPGAYTVQLIVGNGWCYDTITKVLNVDTVVGIDQSLQTGLLQVYPNPIAIGSAHNQIGYRYAGPASGTATLRLRNALGQTVWEHSVTSSSGEISGAIPVRNWSRGLYFLSVEGESVREVVRVVLE